MSPKKNILHAIFEKYPALKQEIEMLFFKEEGFRDFCEDYILCMNSIKKIESKYPDSDIYLKEFKAALEDLEGEFHSYLKRGDPTLYNKWIAWKKNYELLFFD